MSRGRPSIPFTFIHAHLSNQAWWWIFEYNTCSNVHNSQILIRFIGKDILIPYRVTLTGHSSIYKKLHVEQPIRLHYHTRIRKCRYFFETISIPARMDKMTRVEKQSWVSYLPFIISYEATPYSLFPVYDSRRLMPGSWWYSHSSVCLESRPSYFTAVHEIHAMTSLPCWSLTLLHYSYSLDDSLLIGSFIGTTLTYD